MRIVWDLDKDDRESENSLSKWAKRIFFGQLQTMRHAVGDEDFPAARRHPSV